jgi:hypothetical protein
MAQHESRSSLSARCMRVVVSCQSWARTMSNTALPLVGWTAAGSRVCVRCDFRWRRPAPDSRSPHCMPTALPLAQQQPLQMCTATSTERRAPARPVHRGMLMGGSAVGSRTTWDSLIVHLKFKALETRPRCSRGGVTTGDSRRCRIGLIQEAPYFSWDNPGRGNPS